MSDWSYYHGAPRSVVHESLYDSTVIPPRQYRFGGGRYTSGASASSGSALGWLALLGVLLLLMKKR